MSMRRDRWFVTLLVGLLVLPISPSWLGAAHVTSVILCREVKEPDLIPIDIQDQFSTTTPEIHAIVEVADVDRALKIGGAWIAPRKLVQEENWSVITRNAAEARRIIDELRSADQA